MTSLAWISSNILFTQPDAVFCNIPTLQALLCTPVNSHPARHPKRLRRLGHTTINTPCSPLAYSQNPTSKSIRGEQVKLTSRNNKPESIHKHKVKPEVIRLRPIKRFARVKVVKETRQVIESIAVELASGDKGLDRVAVGRGCGN